MSIFLKIENLIKKISQNLQEREEAVKLSILALLSGESIFLLGPPGVAKSLLARKIKEVVLDAKEFEYLMNRFSTPEEIFGPISLTKLEEDKYERKVEGYLPDSEIVFLDEIWKASPSIQNTLLTVINERIFKNGNNTLSVPLKLLIAASNELPTEGEGLEALYDRFLIRLFVDNISNKDKFKILIDNTSNKIDNILDDEKLTSSELANIREGANKIKLDEISFFFILNLKEKLVVELKEYSPYVSDRRWKKIISIIKTSAYTSGRVKVELCDLLLVQNMIWETYDQYEKIRKIVLDCWINAATLTTGFTIDDTKGALDKLESDFQLSYSKKLVKFKNIEINGIKYVVFQNVDYDKEANYFAFPKEAEYSQHYAYNNYIYIYRWGKEEDIDEKKLDNYIKCNPSELPKKEDLSNNFTWKNYTLKRHYVEKTDINKEKLLLVEKELNVSSKILSRLSDKKDTIIKNMKETNNLLVNSYEYNINCFDIEMEELINEYSKRRDDLSFKIKSALKLI